MSDETLRIQCVVLGDLLIQLMQYREAFNLIPEQDRPELQLLETAIEQSYELQVTLQELMEFIINRKLHTH